MQLSIDLTGRDVLVTGSETAARQAVRRYEAAGAGSSGSAFPKAHPATARYPSVPS